jgi:YVTN family beta-propeller protein
MDVSRRAMLRAAALGTAALATRARTTAAGVAPGADPENDRVFVANEDSNTMTVIDPRANAVETTINLTSFDEDPRPPFRFVTGGTVPTHAAMIHKPLYHGAIDVHGTAPSPDGRLLATIGRGTSNVYLIDTVAKRVVGNAPNPQAGPTTNPDRLASGVFVGREPHEATFSPDGREIWVTLRGEDRIAILDTEAALEQSRGEPVRAVRQFVPTINGPAIVWFSKDGRLAFVSSQKTSQLDLVAVHRGADGRSHPVRTATLDLSTQDPPAFTPFIKVSPDGGELWCSHKLADRLSVVDTGEPHRVLDTIDLGRMARPNHLEFVENDRGRAVYASLARVDDGGPGGVASSQIAVVDRSAAPGSRRAVGSFFTHGRESHGLWANPEGTRLYVAHEQDELPGTPNAGQTVATAFDVSDPFRPRFVAQIPLGTLRLPSGELRNKKSINLVYVRPRA